jgi:hypothetical protein
MSEDLDHGHNIPNAWIGSVAGHPFWIYLLKSIAETAQDYGGVEYTTGFYIDSNIFKVPFD